MTDREKLVALIKEGDCSSLTYGECSRCKYGCKGDCSYQFLADHLLANGVTFATDNHVGGKWIPVTERLPEHGEIVLCNTSYFVEPLQWDDREGVWCGQHRCYHKEFVTHWMPLPEPPMRKGENG